MIVKEKALVISQEMIAPDIYDLRLAVSFARECRPGQFLSLYMDDRGFLLPRPISICEIGKESVRLVYRIAGKGTLAFSKLKSHDTVEVMGPLGNGFPLDACAGRRVVLVGGGIGVPPMIGLAESLKELEGEAAPKSITSVLGYRSETFLTGGAAECGSLFAAVEDAEAASRMTAERESAEGAEMGSFPVTHGNVLDAIKANGIEADAIMACGPGPMLRALKSYAEEREITLYVSLEEKMACGIGACLGCVCKSKEVDAHSHVHNKRICKDGPVFDAREIEL